MTIAKAINYYPPPKTKKDSKILQFKYKKPFKQEMEEYLQQKQDELMKEIKGDETKVLQLADDPLYQKYLEALKNGSIKKGTSFDRYEKEYFDAIIGLQDAKRKKLDSMKQTMLIVNRGIK